MRVTITINTENAAFNPYPAHEVARLLREIEKRLRKDGPDDFPIYDTNGNKVGRVEWEG